jgi:DnaK suppressor protein
MTTTTPTLTASHRARLRDALEQQRAFRIDQLAELQRAAWLGYPNEVDRQIGQSLTAGARAALHDVLAALHRMDEGGYGSCANCGTPLTAEQLEVLPQAPLCIPCQRGISRQRRHIQPTGHTLPAGRRDGPARHRLH